MSGISLRSRYQLRAGVVRARSHSIARGDIAIGDRPGGQLKPFCVQLYAMSMPVRSNSTGTPPSEVTQSAMTSAPASCAAAQIARPDCNAPVDVSA
jgi:hypothetical protein